VTRLDESPQAEATAAGKSALAWIAAFALARFALMLGFGLGADESYTVVMSRKLALSYYDHPPLHQWITHFAALAFGETVWVRLPFVALFALTGWLIFALTRDLFGPRAGLIAVFALNVSPFFLASAGGWVVPDGVLLFALSAAAWSLARLFFRETSRRAAWGLWLSTGFFLGLAGLSKYSAVLTALGLVAFLALSRPRRRWFADPAPYVAALLAVAMIAPVLLWNAEHGWASLVFQGVRATPNAKWRPWQFPAMILGEAAYLTPWIFVGLAGALASALRRPQADDRRLFLACLALPAILVFSLTPIWGERGYPHWAMPGWFFAFPLLGAWLSEPWARAYNWKGWARGSAAVMAASALLAISQAATGWIGAIAGGAKGVRDPTLEMLAWTPLTQAPALRAGPAFVVATDWPDGSKVALALGPSAPVLVFSQDPRGWAAFNDSARRIGQDAVIVATRERLPDAIAMTRDYFARLDAPQFFSFGRGGRDEITLALVPAHGLTRAFPVPYPQ
jgi:4-amino-4-deoxy-L-arabinose transferase-like glycosyltransferase